MPFLTLEESAVVASEFFLSLYPIAVKTIPVNLSTQVFSRLLTFSGAATAAATKEDIQATWGSAPAIRRSLFVGLITVLHIYVSYIAFSSLSAGVSMSLFYTYPLWNLVGAKLLLGEAINPETYIAFGIGLLGTFLLSTHGIKDEIRGVLTNKKSVILGVAAALGAAITESAMYFAVRLNEQQTAWSSILELYGGALVWMLPAVGLGLLRIQWTAGPWMNLIGFNLLMGLVGYGIRFYAIPHVKTEVFGLLSYAGVISAFLFGYWFLGERPSLLSLVGAGLIAYAASYLERLKEGRQHEEAPKASSQPPAPPSSSP
jgi:drug/metabolite transporter (DMT)-like permease